MKITLKRITASLLLLALVLGLVGGIPVPTKTDAAVLDADGNKVTNLLEGMNPSFDEFSIPNWTVSDCVSQCDQQTYGTGNWSLKITDKSSSKSYYAVNDKVEIAAGEQYTISAQVYGAAIGELTIAFFDAADKELSGKAITVKMSAKASSWKELTKTFTAPAGTATAQVKVASTKKGTGTVYFDAISLSSKPVDPIVPELVNGNFDAEWTTSMAPGWKNSGASGTSYTRVPNGDGYALGLTKAAGKGYTFRSESFNVQPNTYYTASIDIKLTPGNSCGVYVRYLDAVGTQIENKAFIAAGDYSSEWSTVSVTVKAPANAKTGYILITDTAYSSGVSLFDNAKFFETKTLPNPSFEACGWTHEFLPSGWVTYGAGMAVNKDANYVKSGSQSYALKAGKQPRSVMLNVKPGEEYEATVYVKREAGMTDDAKAQIYLRFFNEEGTRTANKAVDVTEFKSNGWTKLSIKGVAQDGDVYSEIVITPVSGSGWFYFDDASFKQLTTNDLVKNELTNGGFDNRTIKNANPVPKWYASSDNCIDYYALDYLGGERGYVTRVYNTTYTTLWTDPVAVTPGKTLSATVYGTGTGRVQACIYYYANETDARGAFLTKEDGKTSIGKFNTSSNLKEGVWTQVAVSGSVVPENAKYARLWVISLSDSNSGKLNMQMDDACLFYGMPKLELPGKMGVISNPGFEELDASGNPVDWAPQGQKVFSIVDAKKNPDDVYEGRYALKLTVPKDLASTHGVRSELIPIQPGVTYKLSLYAKEGEVGGRGWQLYIDYLDKTGARAAAFYSNTTVTGEWNYCDVIGAAPDNAVCARILIVSGAQKGTVCIDKLELTAMGDDSNAPVRFKGDWSIADADHPRVYFNQERLAEIQRFSKSKATSAYGYAGTVTLKSLITEADKRLLETKMVISHKGMELTYPMTPVLKDPTTRKEYETSPEGFAPGYPYMTAVGQNIRNRMEALTLAYAITGEKKYGERAVQYALDICDWEYWVGYFQTVQEGSGELSSQVTGDLTDSVVMAYDMCYDLLTKAEREKIRETIIEKALEAMYHDCWPRMIRGRDMDHATCMLTAACAIMTKDNMDELKKYMDMGMTYVNWRLNHFMYSGVNEGHMYDSLAIDDIVVTLDVVERCTGYSGPWEHPYMEELAERVLAFFDPVNGTLPAYSDSEFESYYPYSMAIFSQRGNELATYYLSMSDAMSSNFDRMVYFTSETIDTLEAPYDNVENVGYLKSHEIGALRTGFGVLDSLLVLNANNSQQEHNHYDQNSILLAFNGVWLLSDTEYKDNAYTDLTTYQMKYSNSTIFVDGKPQCRKGQGSLELVFDNSLYGYLIGSAPGAYGMEDKKAVLNKFDRHTIMINHDSQPYYLIIDDLESNKARNFGWNFYTNGWDRLEIDGEFVDSGESASGNRVTIARLGSTLHSYFVGNKPVTSKESTFAGYGPTLLLESEKAKSYQFMNVLSVQKGSGSQIATLFEHQMTAPSSTELSYSAEGEISWSTSKGDISKNAILSVTIGGPLVMFRAGKVGDWISFPFEVPETKEYGVTVEVGRTVEYAGTWNLYLDGELVSRYEPNGPTGVITLDIGKRELTAGQHELKAILSGTTETIYNGTIMSVGGILLDTGESMGEGIVKVTETYDNKSVLGAEISYGTVLSDVVLFNRGKGSVSAGKLTTDGQQASVLGLYNDTINEGYAATKATSLKYGDLTLMTADGKVSVAVDYSFAKMPIKNTDDEKEIVLHEDFDIDEPVIKVSTSAEKARKVTILVGTDYPYVATINGETIESTYDNGMLTFTVPAGTHNVEIVGHHNCIFDRKVTHIQNVKSWATCTEGVEYYVSCVCGENGTESFFVGEGKGHKLVAIEAKEPTETESGNIACWQCKTCKKYFADAEGKEELKESDVILLSFEKERQNLTILIVLIVVGVLVVAGVATLLILRFKFGFFVKKKSEAGEDPVQETPIQEANEEAPELEEPKAEDITE